MNRAKPEFKTHPEMIIGELYVTAEKNYEHINNFLSLCILLLFSLSAFSQNYGEIHGQIIDYNTGDPLPYASASTYYGGELIGTTTDEDGRFKLKPLQPGTYSVVLNYLGYDERTITEVEVNPNRITVLGKLKLATNNELPVVEISSITLIDVDEPNTVVMKAAQIKNNPLRKNPAQLVGSITPELQTNDDGQFLVRGSRPGTTVTFVDGVKRTGGLGFMPGSAIKSISVYTGGIPAKYGDATGGVVVIETKSYFDYFYEQNPTMR